MARCTVRPSLVVQSFCREASQFMDIAKSIGKDITSTYTKLEKLTLLAK